MATTSWKTVGTPTRKDAGAMTAKRARDLEQGQNVHGLAGTLLSREARALEAEGFVYARVLRGGEDTEQAHERVIPVQDNVWDDWVAYVNKGGL
jgi:hypothetical protein